MRVIYKRPLVKHLECLPHLEDELHADVLAEQPPDDATLIHLLRADIRDDACGVAITLASCSILDTAQMNSWEKAEDEFPHTMQHRGCHKYGGLNDLGHGLCIHLSSC